MVGSKCRDFKNREVSNVNAPNVSQERNEKIKMGEREKELPKWDWYLKYLYDSITTHINGL